MTPGITFWIVAWSMMAIAFVAAFLAILLGAKGLDKNQDSNEGMNG